MSNIAFLVGHGKGKSGGYDPGAVSGDYHEFRIAREIAKYARDYYNQHYTEQADHDDAPDSAACVCRILDRRE